MAENPREQQHIVSLPFDILLQSVVQGGAGQELWFRMHCLSRELHVAFSHPSTWVALIKQQFPFARFIKPLEGVSSKMLRKLYAKLKNHVDTSNTLMRQMHARCRERR